jgi:hypothetical protein
MSTYVQAKAIRLLAEGSVTPRPLTRHYVVIGDHGTYDVFPDLDLCVQRQHRACSHLVAAKAWAGATPEQERLMLEAREYRAQRDRNATVVNAGCER